MEQIDPIAVAIGSAVREAIKDAGLTIKAVRDDVQHHPGLGQGTFSRKINGHVCFDFADLTVISEVLEVSAADLAARAERRLDRSAA